MAAPTRTSDDDELQPVERPRPTPFPRPVPSPEAARTPRPLPQRKPLPSELVRTKRASHAAAMHGDQDQPSEIAVAMIVAIVLALLAGVVAVLTVIHASHDSAIRPSSSR